MIEDPDLTRQMRERAMVADCIDFLPLNRMRERVFQDQSDSDVAFFYGLLFYGEFLIKLTGASHIAIIQDDTDRTRYGLLYDVVRANSVGDWVAVLDKIAAGPAANHVHPAASKIHQDLTKKHSGGWMVEALDCLHESMDALKIDYDKLPSSLTIRDWFHRFSMLRNKTRGHGAPRGAQCASACRPLKASIDLVANNLTAFKQSWAYLHENLSGKYRVTVIAGRPDAFQRFRLQPHLIHVPDGVYFELDDRPIPVELLASDPDLSDFRLPNGQFSKNEYESLSYITNDKQRESGQAYLTPATELPPSETQGLGELELIGNTFTNIPPSPRNYVRREPLQEKLREQLDLERHPIVTLHGPGGIGKTTLALQVIHDMLGDKSNRFRTVAWFSARDIDLHESGPKPVKPHGVTRRDFAKELVKLTHSPDKKVKSSEAIQYLGESLSCGIYDSTLFVFDNFETVDTPSEFFTWIDTYIREPHKALITTRMRSFNGDYPVQVAGLHGDEAFDLIDEESRRLGITHLINNDYRANLAKESDGHPYVIKILLGEVAKNQKATKPTRIMAGQSDILTALFERTFFALTPAAQRIFLLLSNWRSVIPELAVEAVILRSVKERIDVSEALAELVRMSFVEEVESTEDGQVFISVPLAAMLFGQKKLSASPLRAVVDADTELLQAFGAGGREDVRRGTLPRIRKLIAHVSKRVTAGEESLEEVQGILEYCAERVPAAWLELTKLYEEVQPHRSLENAKEALRRYLETNTDGEGAAVAWRRLAELCRRDGDYYGEIHALVEICQMKDARLAMVSNAANRINGVYAEIKSKGLIVYDSDERSSLLNRAANRLAAFATELDATDCSRLAWLYVQVGDASQAAAYVRQGLDLEPDNAYCLGLAGRLGTELAEWPDPGAGSSEC